ncbi:hypothetical protein CONCODRAFT_167089 [Conidiobolus coronatus NRRL 28638]|uniref:F-box domain-containing protein n=1 Tax=Conidiobolus coronatus (strain ATCC 28846 / CBS 209.66 / NRRL 28638) TaxID=796925 RepID=A0A137NYU2_CONC2|nr:hypothetical protein CONCODRAFT_167089 [Conidiobolus coronatus NRRL 28638]|eukprot:KXN67824.1 hypothetical protein CONCODRAFT_167089 [Conidiobolus coronatus NRRL 28638]
MKDSDWITIFKLKEFTSYFDIKDLIQLSLCCQKFRKCLIIEISRSFNFTSFVKNHDYKSCTVVEEDEEYKIIEPLLAELCSIDEAGLVYYVHNPYKPLTSKFIESKDQFVSDLKQLQNQPILLKIKFLADYHYLLYDVPSVFTKLSTIIISGSQLKLEELQYLLNNLKYLSDLELSKNRLLQYSQDLNQTFINWSDSLKKLKIFDNVIAYLQDNENSVPSDYGFMQTTAVESIKLAPKCLSKLVYFECNSFSLQFEAYGYWKFFQHNPQIKDLKIGCHRFNFHLFTAISCIEGLDHLDLISNSYNMSESELNHIPLNNTVTKLTIHLNNSFERGDKLIEKFPNLKELFIEMSSESYYDLFALMKKFPNINSLKLKINLKSSEIVDITFPKLDNLTSLVLNLNSSIDFSDFNCNVSSCTNLKGIKFTKNGQTFQWISLI